MKRVLLAAAIIAAAATSVRAADIDRTADGYTYFNRPGSDVAAHAVAVLDCRRKAGRMHQPDTMGDVMATSLAGAIAIAIVKGVAQAAADHTGRMVNVENCMVVKGWRVVALDPAEGASLAALDNKVKEDRLKDWVGAAEPHGAVVRTFANDAIDDLATGMFDKAKHSANTALSTDAVLNEPKDQKKAEAPDPKPEDVPLPSMKKSARPPKPLKPDQLGGIPADSALIVVNIEGAGAMALTFERVGPDEHTPAWVDGRPASFTVAQPAKAFAKAGQSPGTAVAFAVPPGRWRLATWTGGLFTVSLCMGAPAFDVAAGEVVYAGSFNPNGKGEPFGPMMGLEPAKALFPSLSGLSDKVRDANYVNGVTGACGGAYLYALEIPGQPFVDGYAMGSRAAPPAPAPATLQPTAAPGPATDQPPPTAPAPVSTPTPAPASAPATSSAAPAA
jgi:hypothetical protein